MSKLSPVQTAFAVDVTEAGSPSAGVGTPTTAGRPATPSTVANWGLLLCAVLVTLAGIEIVTRLRERVILDRYNIPAEQKAATASASLTLHQPSQDPVLKYEPKPGATAERDGTTYRINAQGLRDDDDVPPNTVGERRVVVIGDSVAFGFGVDHARTFAARSQELLKAGTPTRILNQAVLGYKTDQEVRRFERDGWALHPNGVVVAFCLNDFDDFSGELQLMQPLSSLAAGGFHIPPRRLFGFELPAEIPLLDDSLVFRKLSNRLRPDYYRWIGTDRTRRADVGAALDDLAASLQAHGIPGLVVIFPLLVDAQPYPYADIHSFVAEHAAAAGLQVIDLLGPLSSKPLAAYRRSPDDVLHLNEHGHAVVADALQSCLADPALRCTPPLSK